MIKVRFLGPLSEVGDLECECKNLHELKEILNKNEILKPWLKDCAIALNDEIITNLDINLKNGDEICVLPPVCGG